MGEGFAIVLKGTIALIYYFMAQQLKVEGLRAVLFYLCPSVRHAVRSSVHPSVRPSHYEYIVIPLQNGSYNLNP